MPRQPNRPLRKRRAGLCTAVLLSVTLLGPVLPMTASAEEDLVSTVQDGTSSTLTSNWATWLPALTGDFDPASADECIAGKDNCIKKTIVEMSTRLDALAEACDHNAVFSLTYARTTQGFAWFRDNAANFDDPAAMNFLARVFAGAYIWAYDEYAANPADNQAPLPWQIAFDIAAGSEATGTGDVLLGMSAHINRDLPFVLAATGLVMPDGTSRKPDFDKINELLLRITQPVTAELAARFDPEMAGSEDSLAEEATFNLITGWRERAWRNAERLVRARTEAERTLIAEQIEQDAAAEAALLVAPYLYAAPSTTTTAHGRRDHCAGHHFDPPPMEYPYKVK